MKILIVDDSKAARMLVKSILNDYDPTVSLFEAANGLQAIDCYEKEKPDLVFLDLTMPEMDGYEALEKLKESDSGAHVIILTADVQQKSIERCLALGAWKVMKKLPDKATIYSILDERKAELT